MFSLKIIETRENMKKTLIVLFTALLLIATMIVSCTNEVKFDETVQVGFSSASVRGLTASQDIPGSDDLYWFYKASKTPGSEGSQITIGTKTEWTPVKVNAKGLTPEAEGNSGLITLAQGRWDFELQGRIEKDDVNTSVYQGSTSNVLIVKHGEEVNTITVSVSQLATGTGTVKLSNIKVKSDEANFTDYKPTSYKYRASGSTAWTVVSDADFTSDIEKDLPAATYDFVVMYDKVDGGETIVYASAPITITVTANITTTITGSLDVETTMGQFVVNVVGTKATASFTAGASENAITVPITPSAEQGAKTTVTFGEGAVSGDTVLVTEVKSIEESMSANFVVADGSAVAAIDLKITDSEGTQKSIAEGKTVTVETYILKGLDAENIDVVYNGTGAQPTDVTYDPITGKLTFKTSHFSEFYVVSDAVCYNTDKYVGYPDLNGAVAGASNGDTIVLFNNTSMTYTKDSSCITIDNKDITIDGSGKTITLSADTAVDKYGIYITGSDSSKIVTIKNATINTTNLERAIRTYGSIGVNIVDCTITTNGVGVHVKGSNKVDIINTQITVDVIDNNVYPAHLRTAVMVGGVDADVTVNGCTINAVNENKTTDKNTLCKGLYVGTLSKNAKITANDTNVVADFSIAIDGAQNDHTPFEEKPTQIIINSGEYSGLFGSPSGLSYKSLIINGGTFTGISAFDSFNSKDNDVAKLVISGGTFNVKPGSQFIVDGYCAVENEDNSFSIEEVPVATVTFADNSTTSYYASVSYDVANPDVTGFNDSDWSNEYKALSRAFYDVGRTGGTIVINQDLSFGENDNSGLEIIGDYTESEKKSNRFKKAETVNEVVIDLAGHSIDFSYSEADTKYSSTIYFANINVTIQDSSEDKTGRISSHHLSVLCHLGNVVLRVEAGSFLTDCVNGSLNGIGIMKGGDYVYDDELEKFVPGQVSMTGGSLSYRDANKEANSITHKTYLDTFIEGNVADGYTARFDETTGCITVVRNN